MSEKLGFQSFATITGIKGQQFGKEIFSALLHFKELRQFLQVFPEVQRSANGRKIASIKNYVLTSLENGNMRFFSGITASARGYIFYDESKKRIAIDTNYSKLSLNDGQHRFYGISEAIDELKQKINNPRTRPDQREELILTLNELENMAIPIVIFNNITVDEEKALFYDLNNLSTRPSRSATIRLAQTDILSKLAREIAAENEYLIKYGVECNKSTIHNNNPNTILLTTIYDCCKTLYKAELKEDKDFINANNFEMIKEDAHATFNKLFKVLPQDMNIKKKYILEKGFTLRAIFHFIHKQRQMDIEDTVIFATIQHTDWSQKLELWETYGAKEQKNGSLIFPNNNASGLKIINDVLEQNMFQPA